MNFTRIIKQAHTPQVLHTNDVEIYDDRLKPVLKEKKCLRLLYNDAIWSEGPIWWEKNKTLVWSDVRGRRVFGWKEDGTVGLLTKTSYFNNGNTIDIHGNLISCEHGRRGISKFVDNDFKILIDHYKGLKLNSPNDIITDKKGNIWFTDPTFGIDMPAEGYPIESDLKHTSVYQYTNDYKLLLMVEANQPNGLGFSPCETKFYISQTPQDDPESVGIYVFDWDGKALKNKRFFAKVKDGIADGFAIDRRGWLWSSSKSGIVIFDSEGTEIGKIPTPHIVSNCTFDTEQKRLFITGQESLWMVALS
ncbi:SMP-30/gluconolactonase/LRE family protein [Wenyingzhuangia sp. IMCC45533]